MPYFLPSPVGALRSSSGLPKTGAMAFTVVLEGGSPWGFRLQGGREFNEPLRIAKLNPNSKAYQQGIQVGDYVDSIQGQHAAGLMHNEALQLIRDANHKLTVQLRRDSGGSLPEIRVNGPVNGDTNANSIKINGDTGFIKTNATTNNTVNYDSEDMSGSTSDSQSSIIHVPRASPGPRGPESSSPKPSTAVWSPFGGTKVKTYKPVSFSLSNASSPSSSQPPVSAAGTSVAPNYSSLNGQAGTALPKVQQTSPVTPRSFTTTATPNHEPVSEPAIGSPSVKSTSSIQLQSRTDHTDTSTSQPSHTLTKLISPTLTKPALWPFGQDQTSAASSATQKTVPSPELKSTSPTTHKEGPSSWTPKGVDAQPHKEYKPIKMEATSIKSSTTPDARGPSPQESFAWNPSSSQSPVLSSRSTTTASATATTTTTTTTVTSLPTSPVPSYSSWNGTISHFAETRSGLPQYQSPTITLLQKSREKRRTQELDKFSDLESEPTEVPEPATSAPSEIKPLRVEEGQLPKGAVYLGSKEIVEGDSKHTDTFYVVPGETTTASTTVEKKAPKYAGVGPTDKQTGIPLGLRTSIDEKSQKDWYKKMYQTLHKTDKEEGSKADKQTSKEKNTYTPTYVFPESESERESEREEQNPYRPSYEFPSDKREGKEDSRSSTMSLDRYSFSNSKPYISPSKERKFTDWSPPHARYRKEVYKNQPRSITEYEPGYSSIAFREAKFDGNRPITPEPSPIKQKEGSQLYNPPIEKPGQFSKYTEGVTKHAFKKERSTSPASDASSHDLYVRVQQGGDIPTKGFGYPVPQERKDRSQWQQPMSPSRPGSGRASYSPSSTLERQMWEQEEARRRRQDMERITREQKMRKKEEQQRAQEARRHSDNFTEDKYWLQLAGVDGEEEKEDRFKQKSPIPLDRFEEGATSLQRPKKKVGTPIRGKAKALYTFTAQNPKELSFRRHDTIYLLRQIDKNWYEGEKHGRVGIFPVNYVEVITSLDEARQAAFSREGMGKAKYNFRSQTAMEVSFNKGDTVAIIRQVDDNWLEGRVGNRQGIFPVSYVEVLTEPDTPLLTPLSSYAATPATGSPGQLSPVSTISNGPAPTIPSAPMSPRGLDSYDFDQPFSFATLPATRPASTSLLQQQQPHSYQQEREYRPNSTGTPSSRTPQRYGSLDRQTASYGLPNGSQDPYSDLLSIGQSSGDFKGRTSPYLQHDSKRSPSPYVQQDSGIRAPSPAGPSQRGITSSYGYGDAPARTSTEEPKYPLFRAIYTYMPQNEDELELREGDFVQVMEKCDDGWFVGTSQRTKEFGTFPGNYVQPV